MTSLFKVSFLGLSSLSRGQKVPCLALYNLKLYAESDPEIKKNISFSIHDFSMSDPLGTIVKNILRNKPDLLALSCYMWSTKELLAITRSVKRKRPSVKIILGGPDAGARAVYLFKKYPFINGIVDGEGEESFRLLIRNFLAKNEKWKETPGLIYFSDGAIIKNEKPVPVELEKVPLSFNDEHFRSLYGNWLITESSRGCRYKCIYCNYNAQGYKWRTRSVKSILGAIDYAASKNEKIITFIDAGFNQDKKRCREILNHIKRYPEIRIDGLEINIESLEDEDIKLLAETGEPHLAIGLQTTNQRALKAICRRYNPQIFRDKIKKIRSYGFTFNIDLIAGLPEDNYKGLKRSINTAFSLRPEHFRVFPLSILPGTVLEQKAGLWKIKYQKESPYTIKSSSTFPPKELKKALRLAAANDVINLRSFNSIGFQTLVKLLNKNYAGLLEDFLAGKWRKRKISDKELVEWELAQGTNMAFRALIAFAKYHCKQKKHLMIMEDLLKYQHALGKIYFLNCSKKYHTGKIRLKKSQLTQIVDLKFDILPYIRNKCSLNDIKTDAHCLIMQRTPKTVKYLRVPPIIAKIIKEADGSKTLNKTINLLLKNIGKPERDHSRKRLLGAVSNLTARGILVNN